MKLVSLLYHDVVEHDLDSSGFAGADAAVYKLRRPAFEEHLTAIAERAEQTGISVFEAVRHESSRPPLMFTFDDGGKSALSPTADILEAHRSVGHFFVTTDRIGTPGFLTATDISELDRRGHVIGTHTCSHPPRMWDLSYAALSSEWQDSADRLSQIIGRAVTVASVPGGYYTRRVAEAAEAAGIRFLFTSEPTLRCQYVGDCLVVGRFNVDQRTQARTAVALARAEPTAIFRQWGFWNLKKAVKVAAGPAYDRVRRRIFATQQGTRAGEPLP